MWSKLRGFKRENNECIRKGEKTKNQNFSFFIQHVVLWRVFRLELRHYDVTGRNNILVGPPVIDEMIKLVRRLHTDRNLCTFY